MIDEYIEAVIDAQMIISYSEHDDSKVIEVLARLEEYLIEMKQYQAMVMAIK